MKLSDLINCPYDIEISKVCSNSKEVEKNTLFICIKGEHSDGHDFIKEAKDKGAVAFVCEKEINEKYAFVVPDTRRESAFIYSAFYDHPEKRADMYAVTGTNGKTTTVHILDSIYKKSGYDCGVFGTLGVEYSGRIIETGNTTPLPEKLYRLLDDAVKNNVTKIFMEASSHSIALGRIAPIRYRCALYTNLTEDHLDFHKTLNDYSKTKESLFLSCDKGFFNIDDEYVKRAFSKNLCESHSFGISKDAEYRAENIEYLPCGIRYDIRYGCERIRVETSQIGLFGLYNSLSAASLALGDGISPDDVINGIRSFKGVKGRGEIIYDGDFTVMIDYAHTPDALSKLIDFAKTSRKYRKVTLVFGCGGDREKEKRLIMGRISSKADKVIITSDNSRSENKSDIISDIVSGNRRAIVIKERKDAIEYSIDTATDGEMILIAGKGHEEYEIDKNGKHPFSEREIIFERIGKMKKRRKY